MEKICWQITPAAEVDHRGSGTNFVWKNKGVPASAISQKRISCETSSKTPSATHPPAPLATPFTMRERSYSCKSQWNSVDHTCAKNSWNPIYNAEPIRDQSEDDPTTHETVSHPSHCRGRSSRFGDRLCMEKHRGFLHLLSLKNAFRARLPSKLHRQLIRQHHLQSHLHCGNNQCPN